MNDTYHENVSYPGDHCVDDYTRDRCAVAAPRQQEDQWAIWNRAVVRKSLNNVLGEESQMLESQPIFQCVGPRARAQR